MKPLSASNFVPNSLRELHLGISERKGELDEALGSASSKFRQLFEVIVTQNPALVIVRKYPHLVSNSILAKRHIFQHVLFVSGLYVCVCLIYHEACFAVSARALYVIQNLFYDVLLELVADFLLLIVFISKAHEALL